MTKLLLDFILILVAILFLPYVIVMMQMGIETHGVYKNAAITLFTILVFVLVFLLYRSG